MQITFSIRRNIFNLWKRQTDSNSVLKFMFITYLKKARKYKIGVSFILYNNIVIKLHRDVPCKFCFCLPTQGDPEFNKLKVSNLQLKSISKALSSRLQNSIPSSIFAVEA